MTIYSNVSELVGRTPLIRLNKASERTGAEIIGKLESYNPANSVKDRIGVAMIDAAEASGQLQPGGTIVEATSGNTGIALAMVGASRGYK
ncbi:cysteine synthase A, partial [Burkholderia multivorans]